MDNPALKSTLTRDEICEILRSDLLAGKFHYDQPLRETTLAKRFGVSRGPIRDAFLKLSQEGSLCMNQIVEFGFTLLSPTKKEKSSSK